MQFGRGCQLLGPRLPFSGSGCHLPSSLPLAKDGLVCSQLALLWYSLSPLFCEQVSQCLRLELFMGKFFLSLAIPLFGLLSHISSLRLLSGHSGLVLTLSNTACASRSSPHLLLVDTSIWATSPLGVAVRHVLGGFYLFIYSSWLCCPLRIQSSPQTCW